MPVVRPRGPHDLAILRLVGPRAAAYTAPSVVFPHVGDRPDGVMSPPPNSLTFARHPLPSAELAFALPRFLSEPQREKQNMPLLVYFPLIIWLGMLEAMKDDMRAPATIKERPESRLQ